MNYLPHLSFLDTQEKTMISLLKELVEINSHSENLSGIRAVQLKIKESAKALKCTSSFIKTADKYADVLALRKRPKAPIQVLLMGHADTVYSQDSSFQDFRQVKNTLYGPGVADMKGGLVIMLSVLAAIERSPLSESIGWTALINGDEEIGSIGSVKIIEQEACGKDFALVFEPQKEGKFIKLRPSSSNILFTSKGQKAHAGRDFYLGVNALLPLAELALKLSKMSSRKQKIQVNVAQIVGGDALNVVPDYGTLGVNVRAFSNETFLKVQKDIASTFKEIKRKHRSLQMDILTIRPALELNNIQKKFYRELERCGKHLNTSIHFTESGGVTDGNTIAGMGVPTIDSMGITGKGLHTEQEEADALSLVARAKLAALLIMVKAERGLHGI